MQAIADINEGCPQRLKFDDFFVQPLRVRRLDLSAPLFLRPLLHLQANTP